MTCVIYEPPRAGLPCLVVTFSEGSDPVARPFWSLSEAKDYLRKVTMRTLHASDCPDSSRMHG